MGRPTKKNKDKDEDGIVAAERNLETEERMRLKKLALSRSMFSEGPSKKHSTLTPSKTVVKHHGKDLVKKFQRKNRFLFAFPGLLAPIGGGKIGELKDLGTKNPVLYLDFPQGQMKLFGTIVYPKNKYLTLQFSRGGKSVICEDNFDTVILFSDARWIGRKEENPDEDELQFPKELLEGEKSVECDFHGGAGALSESKPVVDKTVMTCAKERSPVASSSTEDDLSDKELNLMDIEKATPARHSERTAGKRFNFAETSSEEDDSVDGDADISEGEEKNATPPVIKAPEISCANRGPFFQATISTFFKKED